MNTVKGFLTTLILGIIKLPLSLMAQDEGMSMENVAVQDSSHMEMEFMPDAAYAQSSGSGNTVIIILVILAVIAALAFFIWKKRSR